MYKESSSLLYFRFSEVAIGPASVGKATGKACADMKRRRKEEEQNKAKSKQNQERKYREEKKKKKRDIMHSWDG